MLRGWPITLMAATGASAIFAFGAVQTAFTPQAQALFIVFAAVLFVIMAFKSVFDRGHVHSHGKDGGIVITAKTVGAITLIAAILAVVFFWNQNQLSGEKIGRMIDRGAIGLANQAQYTFNRLTDGRSDAPPQDS